MKCNYLGQNFNIHIVDFYKVSANYIFKLSNQISKGWSSWVYQRLYVKLFYTCIISQFCYGNKLKHGLNKKNHFLFTYFYNVILLIFFQTWGLDTLWHK